MSAQMSFKPSDPAHPVVDISVDKVTVFVTRDAAEDIHEASISFHCSHCRGMDTHEINEATFEILRDLGVTILEQTPLTQERVNRAVDPIGTATSSPLADEVEKFLRDFGGR